MPRLEIDNRPVEVPSGWTILQAARAAGIEVPTLCHREGLAPGASCMVCLVKIAGRDRLVPACAAPAEEGLSVRTGTPEVLAARRAALELLLSDHLGDCQGPCHSICPARMNIPRMIRQIAAGQLPQAIATVKRHIALPAVLGRICPAPCERGCRRGAKDAPVGICLLKRYAADADLASGKPFRPPCAPVSGQKVAIVGAGPTGLAAAYYLLQAGHACAIYDDHDAPGGMLRRGVNPGRLPPEVLDAEIATILGLGAELRTGVKVGRDVSLEQLRRDFGAVVLAVGRVQAKGELWGLKASDKGLQIDRLTFQTSVAGVFSGGDAVAHQRLTVRAVADGKAIAASVDQHLTGRPVTGPRRPFTVHIGSLQEGEMDRFMVEASPEGRTCPPVEADRDSATALPALSDDQARREAARCLHCDCRKADACRLREAAEACGADPSRFKGPRRLFQQQRDRGRVIYESGKCIDCGLCIQIAERHREALGLTFVGRGFDVRVAVPFGGSLQQALARAAEECVAACPTGALAFADSP